MSGPTISRPAYRIETKRLVLRCWQPEDAPLMQEAAAASKAHLLPFMPWAANEPERVEAKIDRIRYFRASFDRGEDYVYGVFNLDESRVLGGSGLHTRIGEEGLEIGYWIHKDFVGQGLATELSAAVPRKLGYVHEATRRRLAFAHGRKSDSMIWTLFADEYPNSPSALAEIKAFDIVGNKLL